MLQCSACGKEWNGNKYSKSESSRTYYECECGSKRIPLTVGKRVLVIGDIHAPFMHNEYPEFLKSLYEKYDCDSVVNLGDEVDHHAMSRHTTDPDGYSALHELEAAVAQIKILAEMFPVMKLCFGNHTLIPQRQAYEAGISQKFMKNLKEVLLEMGAPVNNWEWAESWVIENVLYCHGIGRVAKARMLQESCSVVQGHYHTKAYIEWLVNARQKLFAVQVGCGINREAYAFNYGKHYQSPVLSAAVIIEGKVPILEML